MRSLRPLRPILSAATTCALLLFPAVAFSSLIIDLKSAAPGHTALGAAADDYAGQTVRLGDVNGDGRPDLVIGARGVDYSGRSACGAVYVVLSSDTLSSPIDLSLVRDDVIRIYGPEADAQLGSRVACADVDGDGYEDVLCGVPSAGPNGKFSAGAIFIVYGSGSLPAAVDLGTPGAGVTIVQGENIFDKLGESIAAGDVNGDTVADIVAGAPFATAEGRSLAGVAFVVYGGAGLPLTPVIDLAGTAWSGLRIHGSRANDTFGTACLAADATGDGIADILVGAPQAAAPGRASAGIGYLIPGGSGLPGTIDTLDDPPSSMVKILGAAANALNGSAFGVADADGDLVGDLLVAAPQLSPGGRSNAGAVYILNGAVALGDTVDLLNPPIAAVRIDGPTAGLKMGRSLSAADLNFDGLDDIIIGIPTASPIDPVTLTPRNEAGAVSIIFGRNVFPAVVDLSLEQTGITTVIGAAPLDRLGNSIAAGQFDEDGFEDLFAGAYSATRNGSFSVGKAFLLAGSPAVTPTTLVYSNATAAPGRVRLEWLIRDDLSADEFVVYRANQDSGENGERLSPNGLSRIGGARYEYVDDEVRPGETYTYTVETAGAERQTLFRVTVSVPFGGAAALHPGAPNPLSGRAALSFEIPRPGRVALRIYDVTGAFVASVADGDYPAGGTTLFWDARDSRGVRVPSGVYFARMEYAGKAFERKMIVVR